MGSKNSPAPPCSAFLPSPVMSHANPVRGATLVNDGLLKIGPPGVVFDACRFGMLASRPSSSFGVVKNS